MGRIVVGVDGSAGSRAALEWGVREAALRGASVEAVMSWENPLLGTIWNEATMTAEEVESMEQDRRHLLDEVVGQVWASGAVTPVERVLTQGEAATVLLQAAEGAELLVVGTRGHGGFVGTVLGSVSHRLSAHAPCPVVIVPTPPEA